VGRPAHAGAALSAWRRLQGERQFQIGAGVVLLLIAATVLAPWIAPYDPIAQLDLEGARLLSPSWTHPLGTDDLSRDLLSRILYGARISLPIALVSVLISVSLGTAVGCTAGLVGGIVDTLLMRGVDAALAIPRVVLLLVILALWGGVSVPALILILGLTSWFDVSRLVRAEVLSIRTRDYLAAARALGVRRPGLVWRHLLPNVAAPVIVSGTLGVGQIVLLEAALSFLGVGVRRPTPSWGSMLADSQELMVTAWWTAAFPGIAIALTVLGFSLLGDGLRNVLDPRTR
jgi:peptide/nickel transport system permease protein